MSSKPQYPGATNCQQLKKIKRDISTTESSMLKVTESQKFSAVKAIDNAIKILCPEG